MCRSHVLLFAFLLVFICLLSYFEPVDACGFPVPAPAPAPSCCCCGGRKKREAVQPHYKSHEVPCPQTEWKLIMEGAVVSDDQMASLNAIQGALFMRFPGTKFLVVCAPAEKTDQNGVVSKIEAVKQVPAAIHFSSAGDGYCNVLTKGQWCQAVALMA